MRRSRIREVIRAISKHGPLLLTGYVFLKAPARRLIFDPSGQWELPQPITFLLHRVTGGRVADEYSCSVDDVCREPVLEEIIDDNEVVMKDQMADELDDGMFNYLTVHCRLLACLLHSLS